MNRELKVNTHIAKNSTVNLLPCIDVNNVIKIY